MYQTLIVAEGKKTPKFIVSLHEEVVEQLVSVGRTKILVKTALSDAKRDLVAVLSEKGVTLPADASMDAIIEAIRGL